MPTRSSTRPSRRRVDYLNAKIETLFELDLYLVILYESDFGASRTATLAQCLQQPRAAVAELFSATASSQALAAQMERARAHLVQKADAFAIQLADTVQPGSLRSRRRFGSFVGC